MSNRTLSCQTARTDFFPPEIDLIPGFACFLVCLFCELEFGIGAGVLIQIIMILYTSARPKLEFEVKKVPGTEDKWYLRYLNYPPLSSTTLYNVAV